MASLTSCSPYTLHPIPYTGVQVGVATDTARKVRAELAMGKYGDLDKLYDE